MMQKYLCNNKGLTLIEIMIAITILATMSLLTATSMQNTLSLKRKIQVRLDSEEEMRSALKVIKKDIQTAFNYNNFNHKILQEIRRELILEKQQKAGGTPQQQQQRQQQLERQQQQIAGNQVTTESIINAYINQYKEQKNYTNFLGEKDSLHFTSLNHLRRFKDAQESNIMEIGYYLASCRSLLKDSERSQCLWRRTTPFIDEKTEEGGNAAVLLENVTALTLTYYDIDSEEWLTRWISNQDGSINTRGRFPDAVKIILEVEKNGVSRTEEITAAIFFTNNDDKKKQGQGANENQPNSQE